MISRQRSGIALGTTASAVGRSRNAASPALWGDPRVFAAAGQGICKMTGKVDYRHNPMGSELIGKLCRRVPAWLRAKRILAASLVTLGFALSAQAQQAANS